MGPDRPVEQGGPAGPVRPAQGGPAAVRPGFSLERAFSISFFGQKIFREVWKRKMRFLDYSFSDYLIGRIGSSGIHPISHSLAPTQQPWCPRSA
jgi:hypothetical protein